MFKKKWLKSCVALTFCALTNVSLSQEAPAPATNQALNFASIIQPIVNIFSNMLKGTGKMDSGQAGSPIPNTSKLARDCPDLAPQSFSSNAEKKAWNSSRDMVSATFVCYNR